MSNGNSFPAIYECRTTDLATKSLNECKRADVLCTPDKRGFYWVVDQKDVLTVLTVLNAREMCELRRDSQVVQSLYGVVTTTVSI